MPIILEPAATLDYTDLDTLKTRLGITDTTDDGALQACITAASRQIDRWCKRPKGDFTGQTLTRTFDVDMNLYGQWVNTDVVTGQPLNVWSRVRLHIPPLLSLTSLQTDVDGDGTYETVWATTDYWLYPLNAPSEGKPYRAVVVNPVGHQLLPYGQNRIQIVGLWGEQATPPEPIAEATQLVAARWWKRKDAPFGIMGDAAVGFVKLGRIDPDVESILKDGGYIDRMVFA